MAETTTKENEMTLTKKLAAIARVCQDAIVIEWLDDGRVSLTLDEDRTIAYHGATFEEAVRNMYAGEV